MRIHFFSILYIAASTRCISSDLVCNDVNECWDNSDEADCSGGCQVNTVKTFRWGLAQWHVPQYLINQQPGYL